MADAKVEREFHTNYRATWKRRVLVGSAALAVLGIAAAAAAFAVRSRHEIWWREGQAFPTYPDAEPFSGGRRTRWYGQVYYLPPGVRKGGLLSAQAAGIACAIVGGTALLPILGATDQSHTRKFRAIWAVWLMLGVLASLVGLVWSFVEFYTSSTVDIESFLAGGPREVPNDPRRSAAFTRDGTFGIESWSCQIEPIWRDYGPSIRGSRYNTLPPCTDAKTSRWLMIPLFVMSVVLLALTLTLSPWQSKGAKRADQQMEMAGADDRRASDRTGDASRSSSKSATAV